MEYKKIDQAIKNIGIDNTSIREELEIAYNRGYDDGWDFVTKHIT